MIEYTKNDNYKDLLVYSIQEYRQSSKMIVKAERVAKLTSYKFIKWSKKSDIVLQRNKLFKISNSDVRSYLFV